MTTSHSSLFFLHYFLKIKKVHFGDQKEQSFKLTRGIKVSSFDIQ